MIFFKIGISFFICWFFLGICFATKITKGPAVNHSLVGVQQSSISDKSDQRYKHLKKFSDLLYILEKFYINKISVVNLIQNAIKGMVKGLDPHSYFLSQEEFKNLKNEAQGNFRGLGIELEIKNQSPVIISVLENSPAYKKGLKSGQIILQINNTKTLGLSKREISQLLKSKRRTQFHLKVQDADSKNTHFVKVRAKLITFKSVVHKDLKNQYFYIRINVFTENTLQEMKKIISRYKKPAGLILDLRGNPGGLFKSAVNVADLFIKKGIIVSIKGREKRYDKILKAHELGTVKLFPILVLIDHYSASAAEILAGALKDHKRGMLLGRTSFGKGSVQVLIPLHQGGAVKLTVANYYTPNGTSIHQKGVEPHIKLKTPVLLDKSKNILFTSKEDTDFSRAVSFLKIFSFFDSGLY